MPVSGGAYYYINQGLGPLFGSIVGWGNWTGLAFASAFSMYGLDEYVNVFVSVNYVGAKETGRLQNVIVVTLVGVLAVFTSVGMLNADLATLRPIAPRGWSPLLPVPGVIFVWLLGFVQITSVAEEIQEPGKNLPRAVIGSVVIVTVIYALVLVVMLAADEFGVLPGNETAVVALARRLFGRG